MADPRDLHRLPLDGLTASWRTHVDGAEENLSFRFENEAWTAEGVLSGSRVQYVLRLTATWHLQQMLLFRDLDEPDLWLANDGRGRWGEVNGAQRREIGGCEDVHVRGSVFTRLLGVRRVSDASLDRETRFDVPVDTVCIDPETLAIERERLVYTRLGVRRWRIVDEANTELEVDVDDFGLPIDVPGVFVRTS